MSNYAQIRKMDISNGIGIGVSIFFSGCNFRCKNCFNQELWNFNYGNEFTDKTIEQIIDLLKPEYIERLSILGGESLDDKNIDSVFKLLINVRKEFPCKKVWLYTGYTYEDIIKDIKKSRVLNYVDIVVDGEYKEELRDLNLAFRGSSNQRVIDVKKTIEEKQIVLYTI